MDTNMKDKEYLEIDPLQLVHAWWKRLWIVILSSVLVGALLFWYASFVIPPKYTADAMMYVNNKISVGSVSISAQDLVAAQNLVDTYVVILNSRTVLNEVIEETGVPYSYATLKSMISANAVNSTEIFRITVTSTDPNEAELIANCICRVLPVQIKDTMEGSSVSVVDYAIVPSTKSSPNVTQYVAFGLLIGFIISSGIIVVLEMFDQFIRSEEYLMQTFSDIPILAIIPDLDSVQGNEYYYYSSRTKKE